MIESLDILVASVAFVTPPEELRSNKLLSLLLQVTKKVCWNSSWKEQPLYSKYVEDSAFEWNTNVKGYLIFQFILLWAIFFKPGVRLCIVVEVLTSSEEIKIWRCANSSTQTQKVVRIVCRLSDFLWFCSDNFRCRRNTSYG